MTREHKLALILGFAVLMVVGVLVGDHFSRARTVRAQPDLALQKPAPASETPEPTPVPQLPPERQVATVPSTGPGAATPGGAGPAGSEPPTIVMGHPSRDGIPEGFVPVGPAAARDDVIPSPFDHEPPRAGPQGPGVGPTTPPSTPIVPPSTPSMPVSSGRERQHPVQDNETLYTIAKRYYGDASLWNRLAEYNKGRVKPNGSVREGVTLRIPPKDVLLGQAILGGAALPGSNGPSGPQAVPSSPGNGPSTPAPAGGARTYTVKKGDTLGTISKSQLGTARRWEEIMSLNRDKLDDETSLQVGMVLKLPAR